jgi:hypothetical protein
MTYLRTKFHIPNSDGSIVITVSSKDEDNIRPAVMLLFNILQKQYPNKVHILSRPIITRPSGTVK